MKPTRVINTAGKRGFPNADWCEDHKDAAIRSNVIGAANLVDCCFIRNVHITHFASACIYDEDESHPLDGPGFTEEEPPNYAASFYSYSKLVSEQVCVLSLCCPDQKLTLTPVGDQELSKRFDPPSSQPACRGSSSNEFHHEAH